LDAKISAKIEQGALHRFNIPEKYLPEREIYSGF
jgi:hypothetical protein